SNLSAIYVTCGLFILNLLKRDDNASVILSGCVVHMITYKFSTGSSIIFKNVLCASLDACCISSKINTRFLLKDTFFFISFTISSAYATPRKFAIFNSFTIVFCGALPVWIYTSSNLLHLVQSPHAVPFTGLSHIKFLTNKRAIVVFPVPFSP